MEMDFENIRGNGRDWTKIKKTIKDGVKREIGVGGVVEVKERVEHVWNRYNENYNFYGCLRFTHGSASCLISILKRPYGWGKFRKR